MKKIKNFFTRYPITYFVLGIFVSILIILPFYINNEIKHTQAILKHHNEQKEINVEDITPEVESKDKEKSGKFENENNLPSSSSDITQESSQLYFNGTVSQEKENITYTEEDVISYFNEQEELVNTKNESNDSVREQLNNTVKTMHSFFFENKRIRGYTFSELTNSAKIKVMQLALSFDNKIDSYFPNYKDDIKGSYYTIKSKLILLYLDTTSKICDTNQSLCISARENFKTMKESFGFSLDLIKGLVSDGTNILKEWYYSS